MVQKTTTSMITPEHSDEEIRMINVALLVCDLTALASTRGEYPKLFQEMFQRANKIHPLPSRVKITPFNVYEEQKFPATINGFDAVVISGSSCSANDENIEWIRELKNFIRANWISHKVRKQHKVKLVGICFGHQIISSVFGAGVVQRPMNGKFCGWKVELTTIILSDYGKEVFGMVNDLRINSIHKEQVVTVPSGFKKLASSTTCPVEASALDSAILTIQGHPELDAEYLKEFTALRTEDGTLPAPILDIVDNNSQLAIDNNYIAMKILDFINSPNFF